MKLCFENKHLHSTRKPGAPCGARWWLPVKKSLLVWAALHCPVALAGEEAFQIDRIGAGEGCRIVAVNKSAAPVTVVARLAGRAYRSNRKWPLKAVVAPHSSMEMARVFAKDGGDPCRVDMRHSDGVGDAFAVPDRNHRYPLPFGKGVYLRVVQAPGGVLTTHKDALNRHAVDFGVPVGTPVLAVRAGTVIVRAPCAEQDIGSSRREGRGGAGDCPFRQERLCCRSPPAFRSAAGGDRAGRRRYPGVVAFRFLPQEIRGKDCAAA